MAEIAALTVADEPATWAALGFAVEGGVCRVGGVELRLAGRAAGRGIVRWALRGIASTELDGLPTERAGQDDAPAGQDDASGERHHAPAGEPPAHANGVTALDHVVAVAPRLDRAVAALQAAGLDLRRVREQPTPAGAPRQAFFRLGAELLEVIQAPDEALARSGGPDGPTFFWGLAFRVADLDAALARLGEHASPARPAVQPGRQIATLRRSAGVAVPVALMTAPV